MKLKEMKPQIQFPIYRFLYLQIHLVLSGGVSKGHLGQLLCYFCQDRLKEKIFLLAGKNSVSLSISTTTATTSTSLTDISLPSNVQHPSD